MRWKSGKTVSGFCSQYCGMAATAGLFRTGVQILLYIVQVRPPLRADRHDERRVASQAHSEHRRFLRRIEQARSSLRAGRGISLEDVETE